MKDKLRDSRGETLIEVLASIVIASLSIALLFGTIMASSSMGRSAQTSDASYYEALTQAEAQTGTAQEITVNVSRDSTTNPLTAQRYGDNGVYSYAIAASGGGSEGAAP